MAVAIIIIKLKYTTIKYYINIVVLLFSVYYMIVYLLLFIRLNTIILRYDSL